MAAHPPLTVQEVRLAERVAHFLLPTLREALGKHRAAADETATFVRAFEARDRALNALPSTASPMARVELELEMLDLARRHCAAHSKG